MVGVDITTEFLWMLLGVLMLITVLLCYYRDYFVAVLIDRLESKRLRQELDDLKRELEELKNVKNNTG